MSTTMQQDYNYSYPWDNSWINDTDMLCDRVSSMHLYDTVILPLVYILVLIVGVLGNGLMLAVLLSCQGRLRVTEVYLMHLAVADLLLLSTFPFDLTSGYAGWVFGTFACKAVKLLKSLSCFCGSFLLACIGFDRYLAVVHAVQSLRGHRSYTVQPVCAGVWLLCLAFSIPQAVFASIEMDVDNATFAICEIFDPKDETKTWVLASRVITHLCFFLPLSVMGYCYSTVVATLCRSQRTKDKQGAIRLAMVITVIFLLCWLPYNVALLVDTLCVWQVISLTCEALKTSDKVLEVSERIGYIHSCLNPLLYAFLGVRFRQELLRMLSRSGRLGYLLRMDRLSMASVSGAAHTSSYLT